ncbi:MAG: OB-fold domain-containing protein [Ilumatobacter sp.]|uniref:OB-fold domain-containing protein n=1 Tax=Ilumatobacter sp. TaxID=1967498 RepID=UPI0032978001
MSGNGTVLSKAVSHRSLDPGWQEQTPYATLLIELAEGPRVLAATSTAPDEINTGQHVTVRVVPHGHDFVLVWADTVTTTAT